MWIDGVNNTTCLGKGCCLLSVLCVRCFQGQAPCSRFCFELWRGTAFNDLNQLRYQANTVAFNARIQREAPHGNIALDGIYIQLGPIGVGVDTCRFGNPWDIDIDHQSEVCLFCEGGRVVAGKIRRVTPYVHVDGIEFTNPHAAQNSQFFYQCRRLAVSASIGGDQHWIV